VAASARAQTPPTLTAHKNNRESKPSHHLDRRYRDAVAQRSCRHVQDVWRCRGGRVKKPFTRDEPAASYGHRRIHELPAQLHDAHVRTDSGGQSNVNAASSRCAGHSLRSACMLPSVISGRNYQLAVSCVSRPGNPGTVTGTGPAVSPAAVPALRPTMAATPWLASSLRTSWNWSRDLLELVRR
jgi:hypothetical protein